MRKNRLGGKPTNKHLVGKPTADAGKKGKAKKKGSRKKIA